MKLEISSIQLTLPEYTRLSIDWQIHESMRMHINAVLYHFYPRKVYKSIYPLPNSGLDRRGISILHPLSLSKSGVLRGKTFQDLHKIGLGYDVFTRLDFSVLDKSERDGLGVIRNPRKNPGFNTQEHDKVGKVLQSQWDYYHHNSLWLRGAFSPNLEPSLLFVESRNQVKELQLKMVQVFKREHPTIQADLAELTYLRRSHPEYIYLSGAFPDLRQFTKIIKQGLKNLFSS